jgi:hypothetical protein
VNYQCKAQAEREQENASMGIGDQWLTGKILDMEAMRNKYQAKTKKMAKETEKRYIRKKHALRKM